MLSSGIVTKHRILGVTRGASTGIRKTTILAGFQGSNIPQDFEFTPDHGRGEVKEKD